MKTSYSTGLGSEYIVYRASDKTIIPDAVVIIPEFDTESVTELRRFGFARAADDLEGKLLELIASKRPGGDL